MNGLFDPLKATYRNTKNVFNKAKTAIVGKGKAKKDARKWFLKAYSKAFGTTVKILLDPNGLQDYAQKNVNDTIKSIRKAYKKKGFWYAAGNVANLAAVAFLLKKAKLPGGKTVKSKPKSGNTQTRNTCFAAGTRIRRRKGSTPIEQIRVGDWVYAMNMETGEVGFKPVVQTFVHEVEVLLMLSINDEIIETTNEHPFYVIGTGWVEGRHLQVGDPLQLSNGEVVKIDARWEEKQPVPVLVYNFEVEDWHTYFVTDSEILVHNKPVSETPKTFNSIKTAPKYPKGFQARKNGTKKYNVNSENRDFLQKIETGQWEKVYKDGYDTNGKKISIHYFESKSGKVFDVKVKSGWSN